MAGDRNEERIRRARARLQATREQMFALAHAIAAPRAGRVRALSVAGQVFPRSRLMRALLDHRRGLLIGSVAIGLIAWRPRLLWRALRLAPRLTPVLRPLITRVLMPRLLRH